VKMYPNPAESFTNIDISLPAISEVTLTVMDITGRTVMHSKFIPANQSHIHPLNISSLKSGLYIVSISSGNKLNKVLKLVVE
ncbi:MAG TPA: T9SS type A sorting domain-containing protein, partial [Bacteroidetes bacterium]|nr:T9SS type A sorting domain-containing protein [Bacteroidota bacterium]